MGIGERLIGAAIALFGTHGAQAAYAQDRYGETAGTSDDASWTRLWGGLGVGQRTKSGATVTIQNAMTLPAVFAAISAIANPLSSVPARLYQDTGNKTRVASEHPAHKLIARRPNPRMGSAVLRQTTTGHALGYGNGYCEIQRTRGGTPAGLWPLLPDRTEPALENGELVYKTNIDGEAFVIPAADVLHVRGLGFDGLRGYSPIRLAREAIGLGLATEEFGAKFFQNEARSGGFIMHPGKLGAPAQANLRASIEQQSGLDNAHRVKILEEGMKWVSTTIPPDDAQFLATREFTIAEIARMYQVPLFLLQSMEKTSSWGSGIEQMLIGFVQLTLMTWAVRWEEELNTKLLTEAELDAGYYFKIDLRGLLRGDMAARAAFYGTGIEKGWLMRNEARKLEDLDPVEGLDEPLLPSGTQTIAQADASAKAALRGLSKPPPGDPAAPEPAPPKKPKAAKAAKPKEVENA